MWFYAKDGSREGPISLEQLQKILRENGVPLTTAVWTEGMDQWRPANEIQEVVAGVSGGYVVQPPPGAYVHMGPPQPNGLAIASMVLGIVGLLAIPIVCSIAAVICGHIARSQIRQGEGRVGGDGMTMTGLITGYLGLVIYGALGALFFYAIWVASNAGP
ncbi:MAG: DUF4190 domain-containing protein [Roseibacillus sp.]|nr:DUF4190 domain-containing protein [Roseibacillus sp.]